MLYLDQSVSANMHSRQMQKPWNSVAGKGPRLSGRTADFHAEDPRVQSHMAFPGTGEKGFLSATWRATVSVPLVIIVWLSIKTVSYIPNQVTRKDGWLISNTFALLILGICLHLDDSKLPSSQASRQISTPVVKMKCGRGDFPEASRIHIQTGQDSDTTVNTLWYQLRG